MASRKRKHDEESTEAKKEVKKAVKEIPERSHQMRLRSHRSDQKYDELPLAKTGESKTITTSKATSVKPVAKKEEPSNKSTKRTTVKTTTSKDVSKNDPQIKEESVSETTKTTTSKPVAKTAKRTTSKATTSKAGTKNDTEVEDRRVDKRTAKQTTSKATKEKPVAETDLEVEGSSAKIAKLTTAETTTAKPVAKKVTKPVAVPSKPLLSRVTLPLKVGKAFSFGSDDMGYMGHCEIDIERVKPAKITTIEEDVALVVAGAMHSLVVSADGTKLWSFGCNDEKALGRETNDEDEEATPTLVAVPLASGETMVKATAGDSHSVVLTSLGRVFIWGNFRSSNGHLGLKAGSFEQVPLPVLGCPEDVHAIDIASGDNHVLIVDDNGKLWSFGVGEVGQLGRMTVETALCDKDTTEENKTLMLTPMRVTGSADFETLTFERVWATASGSFARTVSKDGSHVYAFGLNNWSQLGFDSNAEAVFVPQKLSTFNGKKNTLAAVSGGLHHTLFLTDMNQVWSCGKGNGAGLGFGDLHDKTTPTLIPFEGVKITAISAQMYSFALTSEGKVYSWGPLALHLGHGKVESDEEQPKDILSPKVIEYEGVPKFVSVSAAGFHTLVIVHNQS